MALAENLAVEVLQLAGAWRQREARLARRAALLALAEGGVKQGQMALVLAGSRKLAELNRRFAGTPTTTDVLAFPASAAHGGLLGDVVLARPVLARQARLAGVPLIAHLAHLAAHGTLHLLGYDHHQPQAATRMYRAECRVLAKLAFPAPPRADDFYRKANQ